MKNWKLTAAIVALSLTMPFQALAAGAIAVDDEDVSEAGYGWVIGARNTDTAGSAAMAECFEAGHKACRIAVRFEACGAYAASKRFSAVGYGATRVEANAMALRNCKDCKIVVSDCDTQAISNLRMNTAAK
jgi:hypothetical protein